MILGIFPKSYFQGVTVSTLSVTPYPYRSARIDVRTPSTETESIFPVYQTRLGCFDQSTDKAAELMKYLITGIELAATAKWSEIGKLVRAEFVWKKRLMVSDPLEYRGVVLFDGHGQAIVHVLHALMGYGGSGPILSEQILKYLGVPDGLFEQANRAVWNEDDYVVVFSREFHQEVAGVDTAVPFAEPGNWEWWRVR